jgi:glycosyltransferase involved in cell wall biosynthesis
VNSKPTVCVIIPCYGALNYAVRAVETLFKNSQVLRPIVLIVDDATPAMQPYSLKKWDEYFGSLRRNYPEQLLILPKSINEGLTPSWNHGLRIAKQTKYDYAICTNSDILFTPGWDVALAAAIDNGFSLVGPITNAPGTEIVQDVVKYAPDYQLTDDADSLRQLAVRLLKAFGSKCILGTLNGFFMMAKTSVWWKYAYDEQDVFKPHNEVNSKGQPNPTPNMTLSEFEFQRRLLARGGIAGHVPGSFIFHYRAVTRGSKYIRGNWYRAAKD